MNRLIILGASGHGKVIADIAKKRGYRDIVFLDDDPSVRTCAGYAVEGPCGQLAGTDAKIRKRLMEQAEGRRFPVLIHPGAVVAEDAAIGAGTVVMAGAVINPGAVLGKGCIVNTSSSVDHDCRIGDYVHVSVGAHLAGTVEVGEGTWIGAGAVVSNNIRSCADCMVGAGAVVVKDLRTPGTYVGVPARRRDTE